MNAIHQFHVRLAQGLCLLVAPALMAVSTFLWEGGEYGVYGGMVINISTLFWIPALAGLFGLLADEMPRYAIWGWVVVLYGCVGGFNFGFEGMYTALFHILQETMLATAAEYPLPFNLTLWLPGPIFPLSLAVLSFWLVRKRATPVWTGVLLGVSALLFPASRIPRIEWIAHAVDLLMLVPCAYLSRSLWPGARREFTNSEGEIYDKS